MKYIYINLIIKTNLGYFNYSIDDGESKFIYDISDKIFEQIYDINEKIVNYNSDFLGNIRIKFSVNDTLTDDFEGSIYIKIEIPENKSDKDILNYFKQDFKLQAFVKNTMENLIKNWNEQITFMYPIDVDFIYYVDSIYIKLRSEDDIPKWDKFKYYAYIDQQDLIDCAYIEEVDFF